ncbi:MAG TPA: group III truncated hemoglobin [Ferruginibacter sp.]|nr:group III truncated hemoglobin [Ferruginibacter sp.]HMP22252.1 group III truncated hemoglobin [Ferruginibacter sp.]
MDITSRHDIEQLLITFYSKVKTDEKIGFIFNDIAKVNWEEHIPVITDFWETILLDNPLYTKNAMEVHYQLNQQVPLHKEHFDRWLHLFTSTVHEMYSGPVATLAITRANGIAGVMQHKMEQERNHHKPK